MTNNLFDNFINFKVGFCYCLRASKQLLAQKKNMLGQKYHLNENLNVTTVTYFKNEKKIVQNK